MGRPEEPAVTGDERVRSYDHAFRRASEGSGSIYGEMAPLVLAAHERRQALLDGLSVGDLSTGTVVDFGVGSWGFACIYPRLQHCAFAIGIDISHEAIEASRRISETGTFPYGRSFRYLTSRGDDLQLESESIDLLFAGEAIEHVDHPEAFVNEVYRVLKPGGQFVLTTPNADAYLYRQSREVFCVSPEHVGLMGYEELLQLVASGFEVLQASGFNLSLHYSLDPLVSDATFAREWARLFESTPALATGLVLHLRKRPGQLPVRYRHEYIHHTSPSVSYQGRWERADLHEALTGRLGSHAGRSTCSFPVSGDGVILQFWIHDWSGEAVIELDGEERARVDLYSALGGFRTVQLRGLGPGEHRVTIRATGRRSPRSQSDQVIFHQAIAYRQA